MSSSEVAHADSGTPGPALQDVVAALDAAILDLVDLPRGGRQPVTSVALADNHELELEIVSGLPMQDLYLHVGVDDATAARWLEEVRRRPAGRRPTAFLSKSIGPGLQATARELGVALVRIHPQARWDRLLPLIQGQLERRSPLGSSDLDLIATDMDLFGLAQMVADGTGGMVSIEDDRSHVFAYSASSAEADQLRITSILGRSCPPDYLEVLDKWGVWDRLQRSDEVIEVPAHEPLAMKRRLVVAIRRATDDTSPVPRFLGSIWVQEGAGPLAPDSPALLQGAAAVAARLMARILDAPSTEGLMAQRLFGLRGDGIDAPSVAGALGVAAGGPVAVIGITRTGPGGLLPIGSTLRLHAVSYRRDAVVTVVGERAYVLLPRFTTPHAVAGWVRGLLDHLEHGLRGAALRAAIAVPVADLDQVASARHEVDRVLDATAGADPADRVTTLEQSRTTVLLGEILDQVAASAALQDPRVGALIDYDAEHGSDLLASAEAYLDHLGDVRAAAAALNIHRNTLRYRLKRIEDITHLALTKAPDRLLLQIQLAARGRHGDWSD